MGFRYGFKAEAERISCSVRLKLGLSPIECLDLTALCEFFDIHILRMTELPCDSTFFQTSHNGRFSAMMLHRGMKAAVIHNDTHHEHRQRSNICHDLAHSFLGHTACTLMSEDGSRSYNSDVEAEANFLGGALLLPKAAAIHILKNGLKSDARTMYGISAKMLEYRLRVSGAQSIVQRSLAKVTTD